MTPLRLLASGRDCDVFDVGAGRVLRRYRDGRGADAEALVLQGVRNLGYPAPALHSWSGPEMVMGRVDGPTLAQAMMSEQLSAPSGARLLAGLHDRLHRLRWPGGTLTHRDLHPENVILADAGPVVIDWSNAQVGPPGLDAALTLVIMAQVAVTPGMLAPEAERAMRPLIPAFLETFAAEVEGAWTEQLSEAVLLRRNDARTSTCEREMLGTATAYVLDVAQRHRGPG